METTVLLSVPAIIALTTLGKKLGVRGQWSMLVAVILGGGLAAAQYYLGGDPAYERISHGILLGLSAAGLFDTAKATGLRLHPEVEATATTATAADEVPAAVEEPAPAAPAAPAAPVPDGSMPPGWENVDTAALIEDATASALADMAAPTSTEIVRAMAVAKDEALAAVAGIPREALASETGGAHHAHEAGAQ